MYFMKKIIYFIALSLLFSDAQLAMQDGLNENLLGGKFLLKNLKHKEFLYLSASNERDGNWVAQGSEGISKNSIFIFEKEQQGFLIKNVNRDEYLYVTEFDKMDGDSIVKSCKNKTGKSYFDIIENEGGYLIQPRAYPAEYLLLSNCTRISGDRVVKSWKKPLAYSFFSFIAYDKDWF